MNLSGQNDAPAKLPAALVAEDTMRIEKYICLMLCLGLLVSFTLAGIRKACVMQSISYAGVPTFGSMFSGGTMMMSDSEVKPNHLLEEPGKLPGHWTSKDFITDLIIERCDSENAFLCPSAEDEFTENFRITIIDSNDHPFYDYFTAAYRSFRIFGADLDNDGMDEIIMEYGEGKGTFAFVRKLQVTKIGSKYIHRIFETELNGYIGGNPYDDQPISGPDGWIRQYAFIDTDQDKIYEIKLRLIPPNKTPLYLGFTEETAPLQFPRLVYKYNANLRTYELTDFDFQRLK